MNIPGGGVSSDGIGGVGGDDICGVGSVEGVVV